MIEQDIIDIHICLKEIEDDFRVGVDFGKEVTSGDILIHWHLDEGCVIIDDVFVHNKRKEKFTSVIQDYFNEII